MGRMQYAPTLPAGDISIMLAINFFPESILFLALIRGKGNEKKIKASPRPGNLAGYRILSLFVFCFLLSPVGAYRIRPTKRPDRGDLIYLWVGVFIPAGYIWGVFNTPLPYRQEMSPIYTHNVYHVSRLFCCSSFLFRCTRVGAYRIRPTKRPEGAILSIYGWVFLSLRDTYGAYSIRPYPAGRRCLLFISTIFTTYPTLSFLVFHFLIYLPLMIQIEDTIVSLDVIERRFMCDLSQCRGACCIEGESGAPLEEGEAEQLRLALPVVWDELKEDAREVIRQQGVSYLDADGDEVTSIVNGRDCVFTRYAPDGTCHCALEQAFREGRTTFMKPISCRLYPVRVTQYRRFRAVNLHRWEVCRPAEILGERLGIPAYRFLREPLISKFGTEWYAALEAAAEMVARQSEQK